jgi:CubicO group peptidase (beta-lactamase class C family)
VGHLGFTGTSFWMDLEQSVIVILLTNRVHPSRENQGIKKFRPELHDTVMKAIVG